MKRSYSLLLSMALTHVPISAAAQARRSPTPAANDGSAASGSRDADARVRRAQSHFQRGVDLYEERNYDGALAEFSRAHELVPNYRVLYNLAQTQAERHDYVDAIRLFDEYLELGGMELPEARRAATEEERERLLERVASVRIESNIEGAELWVNGRARGVVPKNHTLQLNAGMADVRLERPGYTPVSRQLSIVGGDSVLVEMPLVRRTVAEAVTRPPGASDGSRRDATRGANTALWLSAGATTLLAGTTATFAVLATRANGEFDRELRQHQDDRTRLDDARSRLRSHAALTDGFGAATVVGLGATLFFVITSAGEEASSAERGDRVRVLIGSSGVSLRRDF